MRGKEYNSHIYFSIKKRTELHIGQNVDLNIDKVSGGVGNTVSGLKSKETQK
jgi:hypothetical protein